MEPTNGSTQLLQLHSEVGPDGVLSLQVPLGADRANTPVIVTIQGVARGPQDRPPNNEDWHEFVQRTYGSCAGLGLEEPDDLPLQERSWNG